MTTGRRCAAAMLSACLILAAGWTEARTSTSATEVRPAGANRVLEPDRIRQAVARYLEQRFAGKAHDIHITLLDPQEPVAVPPGALEVNVLPGALEENIGRRVLRVQILVNGREVVVVEALVEIAAYADVIVAQRLIQTEEVIEPEDVAVARIKLLDLKHQFALEMSDVVGEKRRPADSGAQPGAAFASQAALRGAQGRSGDHRGAGRGALDPYGRHHQIRRAGGTVRGGVQCGFRQRNQSQGRRAGGRPCRLLSSPYTGPASRSAS